MANEKRLLKVCDATAVYNGIALYMAENAYLNDTALDVLKMVAKWLDEAPTVEAEPVVHGHKVVRERHRGVARYIPCPCCGSAVPGNKPYTEKLEYCSVCGKKLDDTFQNYCPQCGAKMDGGTE